MEKLDKILNWPKLVEKITIYMIRLMRHPSLISGEGKQLIHHCILDGKCS